MRMADRAGERVGRISLGYAAEIQEASHHVLDLLLRCMPVSYDRLLHLERGVFRNREIAGYCGADRRPPRLPEEKGGLRIDVDENLLYRDLTRTVNGDHLMQPFQYDLEPFGQFAFGRPDAAARHIFETLPAPIQDAESGHPETGIDTQYPHSLTQSSITAVV